MSAPRLSAQQMVNLRRYPIADIASRAGQRFVARCRQTYRDSGLCMLPEFILTDARTILAREANAVCDRAYFCSNTHNAYLTDDDPDLPADHVRRRQEKTFVGSVAYDLLGADSHLRVLYAWDPLKDFIGAVLGKERFFRFDDPLGACSINVFVDGGRHGWHFDESEFTITLMLQPPESGGAFEYAPGLRGRADEQERVRGILEGGRGGVEQLPFTTGTLLIFAGKQTLHRVTTVHGQTPRLVPVLCYSERPHQKNSESVRKLFWGRTGTE